jgi:PKD repeat protein
MARLSSLDDTYTTGALSAFSPSARANTTDAATKDTKDTLYTVSNNAETKLRTGVAYNGKMIIVEDASKFPDKGLVRVGPPPGKEGAAELIYYASRTNDTFKELVRGFAGSRQNQWPSGSWATNAVTAEPHNAVKDAIINIEQKIGVKTNPSSGTLNQRLKSLEARFLAPKASFRAFPKIGAPSLTVRFQNFSEGDIVRYLWDFGDNTQTIEKSPTHTYSEPGIYTVKLNVITSTGAQGISTKTNYITVSEDEKQAFFYSNQTSGISKETADSLGIDPTNFKFIDQTDGEIKQRFWIFGDGSENVIEDDPNIHQITHIYQNKGEYQPSLLVVFANENLKRIFLTKKVIVS